MAKSIVAVVRAYVRENGRGMELWRLRNVFALADITAAKDAGEIVGQRGRTGGLWPAGEMPETGLKPLTLKGEAMAIIAAFVANEEVSVSQCRKLLKRYDEECQRRSDAMYGGTEE